MRFTFSLALIALILGTGCPKPAPSPYTFRIGDKVQAGPLIFTVIEASWKSQIAAGDRSWVPTQRFLIVRLSVTNSSAETVAVPSLTLIDDGGRLYSESIGGAEIPNLWGLVRNLKPADTMEGAVLFDVEPKSYKLKLSDGAATGRIDLVEMPLQFEMGQPATVLGAPPVH